MSYMEGNKKHYASIDVARSIGIFLVIVGHSFPDASLQCGIQNEIWRTIYHMIYSFHMPLFFFLSGFVAGKYSKNVDECWYRTVKKFKRLMVPYFCWGIVYIPFRILLNRFASAEFSVTRLWRILIGENPYSGLWFLYALFCISLIYIWIVKSDKILDYLLAISCVMLIYGKYNLICEPIEWIFIYLFFYLLGCYIHIHYINIVKILKKKSNLILSGSLFVFLFYLNYTHKIYFSVIVSIIITLLGILTVFIASEYLSTNTFLEKLGNYGMDIFILSGPILVVLRILLYKIAGLNYNMYVVVAIIFAYIVSILMSKSVLRRNEVLRKLFLGMWKEKDTY